MKNVQVISTVFPMGFNDDNKDVTTSFKPGALFIALRGLKVRIILRILSKLSTRILFSAIALIIKSTSDAITKKKSIIFHPSFRYAFFPMIKPFAIIFKIASKVNMNVKRLFALFKFFLVYHLKQRHIYDEYLIL